MRESDLGAGDVRVPDQARQRGDDPAGHVFSCYGLHRMHDARAVEQHRIGVGAADIDADASHDRRRLPALSFRGGPAGRTRNP